jgi:hypothetical protein
MVLPLALLMAGAGTGLQMYGQDKRSDAQDLALSKYNFASQFANQGNQRDTALASGNLDQLGQQHDQNNQHSVDQIPGLATAMGQGTSDLQNQIAQLTASTPQPGQGDLAGAGDNAAFMNARHRVATSNNIRTDALNQALAGHAGIEAEMNQNRTNRLDSAEREGLIRQRIADVMKMQNYAQAVRNAALQRAGSEHGLDQARAASVGSGAMYLGALMGAAAPLANRGQAGTVQSGQSWNQGINGSYGNPANGVDYTPGSNQA